MADVIDLRAAGASRKQARKVAIHGPGTPIGWRDVLRAIQSDETRQRIVSRYQASGFRLDDFEHRRAAREAMSDAITRAEDCLTVFAGVERAALQAVRRRLEWELWP